jgi:beta-lactamase class A
MHSDVSRNLISGPMRRIRYAASIALLGSIGCRPVVAAQPVSAPLGPRVDTMALRRTLDSIADRHHGVVGYSVKDVDTGEHLSRRGDEKFPTASLIKVGVLVTVYDLVAKGALSLDDPLTVLAIDQTEGSGVLQYFRSGSIITVRDAAWLVSTVSDNTATNLLLDRINIRRMWAKMDSLGLGATRIHSKVNLRNTSVAMDSSVKYGLGVTTPNEMARLFELLALGRAVNPAADSTILFMLEHNTANYMLQRYAAGVRGAFKNGETNSNRTECTLWYLKHRVVACVMTRENRDESWVIDNEAQVTMANMGAAIIRAFGGPP